MSAMNKAIQQWANKSADIAHTNSLEQERFEGLCVKSAAYAISYAYDYSDTWKLEQKLTAAFENALKRSVCGYAEKTV